MKRLFALILSLNIVGCATVIKGSDQNVTFRTEPEGAKVTVSGRVLGLTPLTASVEKGKNQSFSFEKEGFKTFTGQLSTSTEGVTFIAILGGLAGFFSTTTDSVTGAIHEFSPDQYYITLVRVAKNTLTAQTAPKIRTYVIYNEQALREQISAGSGEVLDGLFALVNEQVSSESTAVVQKLLNESGDILEFGNKVISFYGIQ
jgi:hypothetical protein